MLAGRMKARAPRLVICASSRPSVTRVTLGRDDAQMTNRGALAFIRPASIRFMLRRLTRYRVPS